jgi:hypothetical protein
MRTILLLAALAVSVVEVLASEIDAPHLFLYEQGATFEQILSGTSDGAGAGRSWDLPSLNDADSIFLRGRTAQAPVLAEELQALIAPAHTEQRPIEAAPAGSDDNLLPAASVNPVAIFASADEAERDDRADGVSARGDLVTTSGTKNDPSSRFEHSGSLGQDGKSDLALSAVKRETLGVAAVILLSLWFALTAVVVAVHAEQKADRRRGLATLHGVVRRSSLLAPRPAHPEERVLQARPDALPAYERQMKNGTANANVGEGAVHAA